MSDYINRAAFVADCEGRYCAPCKEQGKDRNGVKCRACWVDDMLNEVMDAPAADVEPVRHGQWLRTDDDWSSLVTIQCSACGGEWCFEIDEDVQLLGYNYCPGCGCKMDLEDDNGNQ